MLAFRKFIADILCSVFMIVGALFMVSCLYILAPTVKWLDPARDLRKEFDNVD